MATLEEVTAWSVDEIRAEIRATLPAGWVFEEKQLPRGVRRARFLRPDAKGDLVPVWGDTHMDERLLLLGAYGLLWTRDHRPHPDSPWIRRNNPTREAVTRQVIAKQRCSVPDPEDVDPEEVAAVYEKARKKH